MAVNPIDLQVNFSQQNQVGKQQSLLQGNEILRQDHATDIIQKEGDKNSEDIPLAKDLSTGPDKIKDKEKKKNLSNKKNKNKNKNNSEEETKAIKDDNNSLKDPNLGQKIDIIG